jgi:hypothetical protein
VGMSKQLAHVEHMTGDRLAATSAHLSQNRAKPLTAEIFRSPPLCWFSIHLVPDKYTNHGQITDKEED